ncbi:PTS sugar transporter [Leuconostoc carnosum]|uniref:PTS fructose transporter subunit IA n=2 Tax=Leuconostoc carnosum TaxID=1252 RepID=K0DAI2_LEUCJ|nr:MULTISPECIES: hypothetical protein [Leuconostoc]AFT81788.1 hypothetical protein C270_04385 [Leuconostoc carnosum JB16]KAA8325346.1 PTS sugar transporter [Leuconostoc carnosum]KAA8328376.1 PTS sugar transporter [Leuconostoc carnosum]KAA8359568.1 PTS sugar transporter [Leuconostoc carnosum]KAA8365143.1 PTS sugar transporter [Leuconostoc carnosum]
MVQTTKSVEKGYQNEILFQEKMLKNLVHWQSFFSMMVGFSILIIYFFSRYSVWLLVAGIVLLVANIILIFLIGYGIRRGKQNLNKVIQHYKEERPQI